MVKPVKYYKKNGLVQQDLQIIPLFHCKMPVLLSTSLFIIQPHLPCEIESLPSLLCEKQEGTSAHKLPLFYRACGNYASMLHNHAFSCKTFKCHQICSYFKVNGGKLLEF